MTDHVVGTVEELEENGRLLAEVAGREIGVFRVDGEYHAVLNWCPHQAGPICKGSLTGRQTASFDRDALETSYEWTKEGGVVVCPWHGWEFDLETGLHITRDDIVLPNFPVREDDGDLVVSL